MMTSHVAVFLAWLTELGELMRVIVRELQRQGLGLRRRRTWQSQSVKQCQDEVRG